MNMLIHKMLNKVKDRPTIDCFLVVKSISKTTSSSATYRETRAAGCVS